MAEWWHPWTCYAVLRQRGFSAPCHMSISCREHTEQRKGWGGNSSAVLSHAVGGGTHKPIKKLCLVVSSASPVKEKEF